MVDVNATDDFVTICLALYLVFMRVFVLFLSFACTYFVIGLWDIEQALSK
jgi:hypothetical protein